MEACWAHNPEVRRSKLRSANIFFKIGLNSFFQHCSDEILPTVLTLSGWLSGLRRQTQGDILAFMIES